MSVRSLPDNDLKRSNALDGLHKKWSITAPDARLFTQEEYDILVPLRGQWKAAMAAVGAAKSIASTLTDIAKQEGDILEMFLSHFIQVFNLGVVRGKYSPQDRGFYQLDLGNAELPSMRSYADRVTWAQNLITGEAARQTAATTAGTVFKPMANPDIAEVAAALAAYEAAHDAASPKKDAYDAAQKVVEGLRPPVDALIASAWDSIEFNLRHETPPSLRRKAREYGVVYVPRPGEPPDPEPEPGPEPPATT